MAIPRAFKGDVFLGTNTETGSPIWLSRKTLETHLHAIGPTGGGKSRLLLHLFKNLCREPRATIIVLDPKGSLFTMCRDWAISHGLTKRLIFFDPGDPDVVVGFNPLRANGLPWSTHAKSAREGIRAAWGQSAANFDETPQLQRFLYLCLAATREQDLTLVEAAALLRPGSAMRKAILPRIVDPFVREALEYFDSLSVSRQEELAASTLARLEAFVNDPTIRRIVSQQERALDIGRVLAGHHILLVNLQQYRPLRPDDVTLLGRILVNEIVAHVFARAPSMRTPVYVILDEVQDFATRDLCVALEKGRELGIHCVLAHQNLTQLVGEDGNTYLLDALLNNARTRVVFGGSSVKDLEQILVKEMLIDRYNPRKVKFETKTLESEPVESTRVSRTRGRSRARGQSVSHGRGTSWGHSRGEDTSSSTGRGVSKGTNRTRTKGISRGRGHADSQNESNSFSIARTQGSEESETRSVGGSYTQSVARGRALSRASTFGRVTGASHADASHSGWASGSADGFGTGETVLPNGEDILSNHRSHATSVGFSSGSTVIDGTSEATIESEARGESESVVEGEAVTNSMSESRGRSVSDSLTLGASRTTGKGITENENETVEASDAEGENESESETWEDSTSESETWSDEESESESHGRSLEFAESGSETVAPFYEYRKRHVISSRTFYTPEEQFLMGVQEVQALPTGHFVVKTSTRPAIFARAPWVSKPQLNNKALAVARAHIHTSQPYYARIEDVEREERERRARLLNPPKSHDELTTIGNSVWWKPGKQETPLPKVPKRKNTKSKRA